MKTIISKFVTPEVTVRFSNLIVDATKKTFIMNVGIKSANKRKFTERDINGTITPELADWFSRLRDEKVKVASDNEQGFEWIPTGRKLSSFQKYLIKREIQQEPNTLYNLVFETLNTSEDYAMNPFRLVSYAEGKHVLTLVNASPKRKVSHVDVNTGVVTDRYFNKTYVDQNGNTRKSFVSPSNYRRLMIQEMVEVETMD